MRQFRLDFYDEHHYCKGDDDEALRFWRSHQSQFSSYVAVRISGRIARKAASNARRREKKRVDKAAAAAAKVFRQERAVAKIAAAMALVYSSKVEKSAVASVQLSFSSPRSDAAHAALQQERRIRHKAKRVVAVVRKQAKSIVSRAMEMAVQEVGVRLVTARVVSAGVVPEGVGFQLPTPFNVVHPHRLGRSIAMKSKLIPRRKRSARKSG